MRAVKAGREPGDGSGWIILRGHAERLRDGPWIVLA
jgi:hypothetical protein